MSFPQNWSQEAWEKIVTKINKTSKEIGAKFLHASVDGKYSSEHPAWWTSGFWPGVLWQVYAQTKNEDLKEIAESCEQQMDEILEQFSPRLDHDIGFQWQLTSVANFKLTGNENSKRRALHAANLLAGRFNVNGNFIRAWNDRKVENTIGWSIIDTNMNLPLLYWATEVTGDPRFKAIAMRHADMVIDQFIREDGAVHHIVEFDPETGERVCAHGGQGYAPYSAWSRGAAWAIYGMTLSYQYTGETRYLQAAKKVAHFFIAHLPEDLVPVWDFRLPADVTPYKDSSAAAIAASGMLLLAEKVDSVEGKLYRETAEKMLYSLYQNYGTWDNDKEQGLILHGASHVPKGKLPDNPLIYGDYYFVEAIAKLNGSTLMFW